MRNKGRAMRYARPQTQVNWERWGHDNSNPEQMSVTKDEEKAQERYAVIEDMRNKKWKTSWNGNVLEITTSLGLIEYIWSRKSYCVITHGIRMTGTIEEVNKHYSIPSDLRKILSDINADLEKICRKYSKLP